MKNLQKIFLEILDIFDYFFINFFNIISQKAFSFILMSLIHFLQ
jgi:hypothetical protein